MEKMHIFKNVHLLTFSIRKKDAQDRLLCIFFECFSRIWMHSPRSLFFNMVYIQIYRDKMGAHL